MFEDLFEGLQYTQEFIEKCLPENEQQILRIFLKNMNVCLKRIIDNFYEGKPIIGYHFTFPAEFLYAFDCVPINMEPMPYFTAALLTYGPIEYYNEMVAFGHPFHTCSANKGTMGMALRDELTFDTVICQSGLCDSSKSSYQFYPEIKNIPLVAVDTPYYHNDRGFEYYTTQFEKMITRLSKIIGQEPNYKALEVAVKKANQCVDLMREINELRRLVPCPFENLFNPLSVGALTFMSGTDEAINFYKDVLDLGKVRSKKGEFVGLPDKTRSIWPYMSIFFDIGFSEWMDREAGFAQLLDVFSYYYFDEVKFTDRDSLIKQLAIKSMEMPMIRQSTIFAETYIDDFVKLANLFKADCAVFTAHLGCKQVLSLDQMIREALRDELGIPSLTIEIDIGDKRYTPIEKIKDKMLEFKKTLF
ncbi:MAG: 2-hydroxyacyl-CoA dehydratase [Candidatus Helarchaeota archaeon]